MATDRPMHLGMVGLGRMGSNLSLRSIRDGHTWSCTTCRRPRSGRWLPKAHGGQLLGGASWPRYPPPNRVAHASGGG